MLYWIIAVAAAIIIIGMLVIFFLVRRHYERREVSYQNKLMQKQVDEVQHVYETMRGWRHDYHNHLQSLKVYVQNDQKSQAVSYLDRLEKDLESVDDLIRTGNVAMDAILNSKLSLAMQRGIAVDYSAAVPQKLTVRDIDLCVIIGNLIDNAVEACDKIVDGRKFIRLYIGVLKDQLYISVTNATTELVRKLDAEYVTKKRGNHGHGLKRINLAVEKYEGFVNRKNEPGVFVTEIMLPL